MTALGGQSESHESGGEHGGRTEGNASGGDGPLGAFSGVFFAVEDVVPGHPQQIEAGGGHQGAATLTTGVSVDWTSRYPSRMSPSAVKTAGKTAELEVGPHGAWLAGETAMTAD